MININIAEGSFYPRQWFAYGKIIPFRLDADVPVRRYLMIGLPFYRHTAEYQPYIDAIRVGWEKLYFFYRDNGSYNRKIKEDNRLKFIWLPTEEEPDEIIPDLQRLKERMSI